MCDRNRTWGKSRHRMRLDTQAGHTVLGMHSDRGFVARDRAGRSNPVAYWHWGQHSRFGRRMAARAARKAHSPIVFARTGIDGSGALKGDAGAGGTGAAGSLTSETNGAPQDSQNFAPSTDSFPQFGQFMMMASFQGGHFSGNQQGRFGDCCRFVD